MTPPNRRERIAQAIHDGPNAKVQYAKAHIPPHSWESCPYQAEYLADADAVLAPGVLDSPAQIATTRDVFVASLGSALGWHWEEAPGVPSAEDVLTGIHDALREEGLLVSADQVRADTLKEALRVLRGEFVPLVAREPDWHNVDREITAAFRVYRKRVQS